MSVTQVPPLLHEIPDACQVLGIGRSMLYELKAAGEIDTVKVGRRTLIPHDSLVAFVERHRATAGAASLPEAS